MKIECSAPKHFFENLHGEHVFRQTVHIDKSLRSLTGEPVRESSSVEVVLQLSAIVQYFNINKDGDDVLEGDALVECGWSCGVDRYTGDGGLEGTLELERQVEKVHEFCKKNGLRARPGLLGM
jgi:hypothetical protein